MLGVCHDASKQSPPVRGWLAIGVRSRLLLFFLQHARFLPIVSLRDAVAFCSAHVRVCQCGSWCGILSAVYSCCGWLVKARCGRQLVIRLIMLPFLPCEVGLMWLLSAIYIVLRGENLSWVNVLNVVRDVLHNAVCNLSGATWQF